MGLYIYGKHSDKECHWGYAPLHWIRDLALMTCGVKKEFSQALRSVNFDKNFNAIDYLNKYYPALKISNTDLYGLRLAWYYYPNLLFHSDCDGTYTKYGKIMKDSHWLTGSLAELEMELNLLKNELKKSDIEISETEQKILNEFSELVTDEMKYKRPVIYFS